MDLALSTTLPSPLLLGERVEHLPQGNSDTSAYQRMPQRSSDSRGDYVSLEKRLSGKSQIQRDYYRPLYPTQGPPRWIGYYLRNAMLMYYIIAGESIPAKPIVDLYA